MKPEKQVEKEILSLAPLFGFDLTVVDSAHVYSNTTRMFSRRMTNEVCSDMMGNNGQFACFVEIKAIQHREKQETKRLYHSQDPIRFIRLCC